MNMMEPLLYLPHMRFNGYQIDPATRVPCPVCKETFVLSKGVAFEATVEGEATMGFFCTTLCVLKAYPINCCGRA